MTLYLDAFANAEDPLLPIMDAGGIDETTIFATGPGLWIEARRPLYVPREGPWTGLVDRQAGLELREFTPAGKVMPARVTVGDLEVLAFETYTTGALKLVDPIDAGEPDLLHPTCNSFAWLGRYGAGQGGAIFGNRIFADQFGIIVDPLSGRVNAFARFGVADSTTADGYADDEWHVHIVSMDALDTLTGRTVHRVDGVVANAGFTTGARPIATTEGARKAIIGATSADASAYPLTGQLAAAIVFPGIALHRETTIMGAVERHLTAIMGALDE
ncbi:MAG: hypothetical protein WBL20_00610 [Sphingobium sp.]|uniref:hypothetical protein n=1 Tax=Sphingobium sp. TaxID=1912891 RepID=UPI003BB16043